MKDMNSDYPIVIANESEYLVITVNKRTTYRHFSYMPTRSLSTKVVYDLFIYQKNRKYILKYIEDKKIFEVIKTSPRNIWEKYDNNKHFIYTAYHGKHKEFMDFINYDVQCLKLPWITANLEI